MKVRIIKDTRLQVANLICMKPGSIIELPEDVGKAWILKGHAEAIRDEPKIETATISPAEQAVAAPSKAKAVKTAKKNDSSD